MKLFWKYHFVTEIRGVDDAYNMMLANYAAGSTLGFTLPGPPLARLRMLIIRGTVFGVVTAFPLHYFHSRILFPYIDNRKKH